MLGSFPGSDEPTLPRAALFQPSTGSAVADERATLPVPARRGSSARVASAMRSVPARTSPAPDTCLPALHRVGRLGPRPPGPCVAERVQGPRALLREKFQSAGRPETETPSWQPGGP